MSPKSLDWRALLEAGGALAVVTSLIFVGVQMSESARATRSAIAAETVASLSEWYSSLTEEEELAELFRQYIVDPQSLTRKEQFRAGMHLHGLMLIMQNSFYLEEEGTLDARIRRSITEPLNVVGSNPGLRFYWEQRGPIFVNETFKAFVEEALVAEGSNSSGFYAPAE